MTQEAKNFGTLVAFDNALRIVDWHENEGKTTMTVSTRDGMQADFEFAEDSITGMILSDQLIHVWEIGPQDFKAALHKLKELM